MNIIMCRPDFFDVTYALSTNRWMNPGVRPDQALAWRQWNSLLESYRNHGVDVSVMCGQPYLNDMTFVANAGLPLNGRFVLSNFFHEERKAEMIFLNKFFSARFEVVHVSDDITFEGQGDALLVNRKILFVGCGIRTNNKAVHYLQMLAQKFDSSVIVTPLFFRRIEDYEENEHIFYHLDTCLLYLEKIETFLVYPRAFQGNVVSILRCFGNVVEVTKDEAESFVCNSVVIGNTVFMPKARSDRVINYFYCTGYDVSEHDMSEFIKSGGAVKCLSLEI